MSNLRNVLVLVAVLAIALVTAIACGATTEESPTPSPESSSANTPQGGISVSGTASISLAPDTATIVLGVQALHETVAQARADAAAAMTSIVEVLTAAGVADEDIQTQHLSIQPQYDYSGETRELKGFTVVNIVNVTVRDIDSVGAVIDQTVAAGGDFTRVQSIYFSVDDTSSYEDQLIEEAVQDATAKAQRLADLTGITLGKPLSINYGGGVPYPIFDRSFGIAMAESAAFDTPISAGEVETSVTISIIFAIN